MSIATRLTKSGHSYQSLGMGVLAIFAVVTQILPTEAAADSLYYCPKGNGTLTNDGHNIYGRVGSAFPSEPRPAFQSSSFYSPSLDWKIKDCTNDEFLCFDAFDFRTNLTRRFFVPRHPEPGKTYHYGNANALVIPSASFSELPTVQVIDSEQISGKSVAIKLTLRRGKGVVFIDGQNFWNPLDYQQGETCILESRMGFFGDAKVMASPGKVITDF